DEGQDLARGHVEVDAVEGLGGPEGLAHAAHREARRGRYFSHFERAGATSSFISGWSLFSGVTMCTPGAMPRSPGSPLRWATIVFTPRYPIFTGSWRTSPWRWPSRRPCASLSEESKPTYFTLPAQPLSWSTRSMARVVDSFGQKIPSTSRPPSG